MHYIDWKQNLWMLNLVTEKATAWLEIVTKTNQKNRPSCSMKPAVWLRPDVDSPVVVFIYYNLKWIIQIKTLYSTHFLLVNVSNLKYLRSIFITQFSLLCDTHVPIRWKTISSATLRQNKRQTFSPAQTSGKSVEHKFSRTSTISNCHTLTIRG